MALTLKQKYDVMKHLHKKGSLLVHKIPLIMHKIFEVKTADLVSYLDSLVSRGFIEEHYVWRHGYYLVTPDGYKRISEEIEIPGVISEAVNTEAVKEKEGFNE